MIIQKLHLKIAFKNCTPFRKCRTEINETFIDEAEHININVDLTVDANHIPNNSSSFKCK